jgi:prevent-host-death family protein
MITTIPALRLRRQLGEILEKVARERQRFIVEKGGIPLAVILEFHEYEDILNKLEILAEQLDPEFQQQLKEGWEEYKAGKAKPLDQALASLEEDK